MGENTAEYRKKRLEMNRDLETLITEETEERNVLKKPVFDVLEYIEVAAKFNGNGVEKKILKLKEYGITDEQIVLEYKKYAGTMENEKSVVSNLDMVFKGLINYINNMPNGIVINPDTGEKNKNRSDEEAIQYGMYQIDNEVIDINKIFLKDLKKLEKWVSSDKIDFLMENFKDTFLYNIKIYSEMGNDFDKFLKKNENDMNLSESLKKFIKDSKAKISNSQYKSDPFLFEICKLQVKLKGSKNTQEYNEILGEIAEFYKTHPKYIARELPVLNQDGSLNKNEIIKMQEYSELRQKNTILEHIDEFNGMTSQNILNVDSTEKQHMIICAFSGLKYQNDQNDVNREIASESMKMIKQFYPNIDLNNEKQLAGIFKEVSGIDAFESLSLQELVVIYSRQLKEATENHLVSNKEKESDSSNLEWESSERIVFDSAMKNFFVGSNINFTEQDEEEYNKLYQDVTIESWIENKENAIKLRYDALITIRDEYKNNPVGTYTEKKLVEIERDIEEFERKFGTMDLTPKEDEIPFDVYRDDFVKAGLTKYLTRDAREWSQGADYKNLSAEHKKGYIRNILVALDDSKAPNLYMTKIALRRLELMGDDFVKINSDGTFEVNEELVLEEYKKLSDYNYSSYKQLAESAKLRKNEYLLKKLEEYTNLPEKAFVELTNRNDAKASIAQIDEARYLSNQKRIEQLVNKTTVNKVEKRKKTEEQKQDEKNDKISDRDIFESFKDGVLEVEVMKVSKDKIVATPQIPRDESRKDQEEQVGVNDESNAASEIKAIIMDTTAVAEGLTQNENIKPSFIESVKSAFARVKNAISKIIKNEEKPKELGTGRRELTEEEKKTKYEETFRPVSSSQASRTVEVTTSTLIQTVVRDEER